MHFQPHVGCSVENTLLGFIAHAARPRFCPLPRSGGRTDGAVAADHCIIHGRATAPSSSHPYGSRTGRGLFKSSAAVSAAGNLGPKRHKIPKRPASTSTAANHDSSYVNRSLPSFQNQLTFNDAGSGKRQHWRLDGWMDG